MDRYFDDFEIGERFRSRGATMTEADIIEFALACDPQPFHIDTEAAAKSPSAVLSRVPTYLRDRMAHVSSRGLVQGVQYGFTRGGRVALDSAREAGRYDIYGGSRIGKTSLGLETGSWLVANGILHGQPARRDGIDDVDPSHSVEAPVAGESGQQLGE